MTVRSVRSFSLGGFFVVALMAEPQAMAQANAAPEALKFEVASVKVATSGFNGVRGGCRGVDSVFSAEEQERGGIPPLGRCRITDARLSHLIGIAYGVSMQALDTGPEWIQRGDLRFDVEAKAENPASATERQLLTMLQNLLVERFQIKFHYVTKEEAGFALLLAKRPEVAHVHERGTEAYVCRSEWPGVAQTDGPCNPNECPEVFNVTAEGPDRVRRPHRSGRR